MDKKIFFINLEKLHEELKEGVKQLAEEYPVSIENLKDSIEILFEKDSNLLKTGGLKVIKNQKITVKYGRKTDAFRALGRILGEKEKVFKKPDFYEIPKFTTLGVMIESSRNGVMTVENIKAFLRRFALMGINMTMLYTEDTYEVPEQPFFGYLRGGYTQKELKEIDDYAYNLGIEMIPCIQTLSHLAQILQWNTAFNDVTDTINTLLLEEEKTYKLLEQMISSATAPYRSKRIHLGMDEALDLGNGRYRELHGEPNRFELMNGHLARVLEICAKYGLKPMIWDDMFFRIGSKTHDYYELDSNIPQNIIDNIPKNVDFVYWDYYHRDYDFYMKFIDLHKRIGKTPIAAPGAWNWGRFWANIPVADITMKPFMKACRDNNIKEAFITTWGDDEMENDIYSALPAVQSFAESGYSDTNEIDEKLLRENFYGTCKVNYDDFCLGYKLDSPPHIKEPDENNMSKWLLWDDMFIGLCEPLQEGRSFKKYYSELAGDLKKRIGKDIYSKRLAFPMQIAKVISMKCDLRKELVSAYRKKDKKKLALLLKNEVRPLLAEMKKLWQLHCAMWRSTYKPFGLECIEMRYGTLITRTQSLINCLEQYLKGKIKNIPEFETQLLKFQKASERNTHGVWGWRRIATPSSIS